MAALSILSYNLPQGLNKMKPNSSGSSTPPTAHNNNINNNNINNINTNGGIIITGNSNSINLSKTFNKITVQNVLSENNGNTLNISNNVNTIVRKIKDFGMFGSVNNAAGSGSGSLNNSALAMAARKRPLGESKASNVDNSKLPVPATKKPKLTKVAATPKSAKKSLENVNQLKVVICDTAPVKACGTPGRKGLPLPQAVARRNARERNRVKQVNNGFAALRERIPEEVAEVFEVQGNGRGNQAKKLSKVETLRMAVEYIRNLESLLGFDFPVGGASSSARGSSSGEDSFTLIKDEFDAVSPEMDDQYDDNLSNYDVDEFFNNTNASSTVDTSISNQSQSTSYVEQSEQQPSNANNQSSQMDILPNITTLNGFQYIRIPGTNTYQLLTPDIFVGNSHSPPNSSIDEEQFNALIDTNCLSPVASSSVTTTADLHSSPPSIIAETTANASAPANTLPTTTATTTASARIMTNGECVNIATSSLSRSPVPQTSSPNASSSLHHHHHQQQQQQQQQQQHHRQQQLLQPAMLSPAANELLMQTCATTDRLTNDDRQFVAPTPPQQYLQPRMIKQEFKETDFISTTPSPTANALATSNVIYQMSSNDQQQQQQQQLMLNHPTLTMSPPLDRCSSTNAPTSLHPTSAELQAFYDHDQSGSFYEGVVTFKKELNDVLLDTSSVTAGLSDESMMEAIDWWEAHTPKSDGGSVIL